MKLIEWLLKAAAAFFILVALYWGGNDIVYMLVYIFAFVYLFFFEIFSERGGKEKAEHIILYGVILGAQIVTDVLVIRQLLGTAEMDSVSRLAGIGMMLIPFLLRGKSSQIFHK